MGDQAIIREALPPEHLEEIRARVEAGPRWEPCAADRALLLAEVDRLAEDVQWHMDVRAQVERVLDEALGSDEADGSGEGLAGDVSLLMEQRDQARTEVDRLTAELVDAHRLAAVCERQRDEAVGLARAYLIPAAAERDALRQRVLTLADRLDTNGDEPGDGIARLAAREIRAAVQGDQPADLSPEARVTLAAARVACLQVSADQRAGAEEGQGLDVSDKASGEESAGKRQGRGLTTSGVPEPSLGPATPAPEHVYLSTGCLHGQFVDKDGNQVNGHRYCQSMTGMAGSKRPGRCKWCEAKCVCPCHQGAESAAATPASYSAAAEFPFPLAPPPDPAQIKADIDAFMAASEPQRRQERFECGVIDVQPASTVDGEPASATEGGEG